MVNIFARNTNSDDWWIICQSFLFMDELSFQVEDKATENVPL